MTTASTVKQKPTMLVLDPALHVARRASWGPTPALVSAIRKAGPTAWVEAQLAPSAIADTRVDGLLSTLDTLKKTPAQLKAMNPAREKEDYFYAHTQLETAAVIRATWSNRQLFEVMVDFWHSRLHVPAHFDKSRDTLNDYDRVVIRGHALGTFEAMLWAMVTHPAMILYLDNQQNTKSGGNQNLGRELLELHTLGVDAGYTQADVENAAKLLTGLSVDPSTLKMVFRPEQHFVGKVKVFGTTYANATASGGLTTLRSLVKKLATHPKTAEYLATDLVRRFVSDAPPRALVSRLAKTYLENATAVKPVLRQLFESPEFKASVGPEVPPSAGEHRRDDARAGPAALDERDRAHVVAAEPALGPRPDGAVAARAHRARRLRRLRPALAVDRRDAVALEHADGPRRRLEQGLHQAGRRGLDRRRDDLRRGRRPYRRAGALPEADRCPEGRDPRLPRAQRSDEDPRLGTDRRRRLQPARPRDRPPARCTAAPAALTPSSRSRTDRDITRRTDTP